MKIFIDDMTVKQYLKMKADLVTNTKISEMCGYSRNTKQPLVEWRRKHSVTQEVVDEYCHKIWNKRMEDNIEKIKGFTEKKMKPFYMSHKIKVKPIYFRNWYFKQVDEGRIKRGPIGRKRTVLTLDEVARAKANGIAEKTAYQRIKYLNWSIEDAITGEVQYHENHHGSKVTNS